MRCGTLITRVICAGFGILLSALVATPALGDSPKRILILNPFGRDVEPHAAVASAFRSRLVREMGEPVEFDEIPLDLARIPSPDGEGPLVDFLEDRIRNHPVDLVVPIGATGAQFTARHRERLFPKTPILLLSAESRLIPPELLTANVALVTQKADLAGMVEDILQLRPQTAHIAVVFGASSLEDFWVDECRRKFQPFADRIEFIWLNELPLDQIVERCAVLPPDSFILHGLFVADGAGIPSEKNEALRRLRESANAPLFGYFESEFGLGPIGGRLFQNIQIGEEGARGAARILRGESPANIPHRVLEPAAPVFDWRELRRWGIAESALPAGSRVEFREPSFWERYPKRIGGAFLLALLQGVLIIGLLLNRTKRLRGEAEADMIADISSKFVNLLPSEVDHEIAGAQGRICEFYDLDLSVLWQRPEEEKGFFQATHIYRLAHGPVSSAEMKDGDYPWMRSELLAGRIVCRRSIEDLPQEAGRDLETARGIGVQSFLALPLSVGGEEVLGVLSLYTTRKERDWPESTIDRMNQIGQVFANALARKRADQALRESELRLSIATDSAEAGLWVLDGETRTFWANERGRTIFGYSPEEPIDMARFQASVHPADWDLVQKSIADSLETGSPVDVQYRVRLPGDQERWIVSRGRLFSRSNGESKRLFGLSMDMTRQRQAEKESLELRANLAHASRVTLLGQLSSGLAHELNQPLGAILRNAEAAEILLRDPSPNLGELRAIVDDILKDDQRAGQVINRLRSLFKRRSLEIQPVDLRTVIEEVLSLAQVDAAARRVRLVFPAGPDLPEVAGDWIHLQQVVLNLVVNAMDAMERCASGDHLIEISLGQIDAGFVEVRIADNGPGIPADSLGRLFEPFFTSKSEGLGVGLPVSKAIVEAHRGGIWAENRTEGGALFCFTVPVAEAGMTEKNW